MKEYNQKQETTLNDNYGQVHGGSGSIFNIFYQGETVVLSETEKKSLLTEYAGWQKERYEYLPVGGIPVPLNIDIPLDQVYIKLRSLPQQRSAGDKNSFGSAPTLGETLTFIQEFGEMQWHYSQTNASENKVGDQLDAEIVTPENVISACDKVVIIGIPGSGKSTLLRHLVWENTEHPLHPVPLLIPLGLLDILMSQSNRSFLEIVLEILTEHKLGEAKAKLKKALGMAIEAKQVRFLLDGWDEVYVRKDLMKRAIVSLAADAHKVVVTSRPISYERLEGFEHYEVLPLLPQDAHAFSIRWFDSLAQALELDVDERHSWSEQRASWLKRQIDSQPGIKEIARVPLLLTFLAILAGDSSRAELPRLRKNLYKEYVERLFTTWETRRKPLHFDGISGEQARTLALWGLYRLAYILHLNYYSRQAGQKPTTEFIRSLLSKELALRWKVSDLQSDALAAYVLEFWEGAGLVIRYTVQAEEILAFRHLTFQEYGASRILAETDSNTLWNILLEYIYLPQWGELIPLTLALLPADSCTKIIKHLLELDLYDLEWHRPLLLAANALAEGANPDVLTRRSIIDMLINFVQAMPEWRSDGIGAITIFEVLARQENDAYCVNALQSLATSRSLLPASHRLLAAEAIGRSGRIDEAVKILHQLLEDNNEGIITSLRIVHIFAHLNKSDEAQAVLEAVMDKDKRTISYVPPAFTGLLAEAFAELGQFDRAVEILTGLAEDRRIASIVRIEAVRGLIRLKEKTLATDLLFKFLREDSFDTLSLIQLAKILDELGLVDDASRILKDITKDAGGIERIIRSEAEDVLNTLEKRYSKGNISEETEADLSLKEHFIELRNRFLVTAFIGIVTACLVLYFFSFIVPALQFMIGYPVNPAFASFLFGARPYITLELTLFVEWPVLVLEAYLFAAPGLYEVEKQRIRAPLFLLPFAGGFYFLLPFVLLGRILLFFHTQLPAMFFFYLTGHLSLLLVMLLEVCLTILIAKSWQYTLKDNADLFLLKIVLFQRQVPFYLVVTAFVLLLLITPTWIISIVINLIFCFLIYFITSPRGFLSYYQRILMNPFKGRFNFALNSLISIVDSTTMDELSGKSAQKSWRKFLTDSLFVTISQEELSRLLRDKDDIPAHIRWLFVNRVTKRFSGFYVAFNVVFNVVSLEDLKPFSRLWAAEVIVRKAYPATFTMAPIVAHIALDHTTSPKLRVKGAAILYSWRQYALLQEVLEDLVRDRRVPRRYQRWAARLLSIASTKTPENMFSLYRAMQREVIVEDHPETIAEDRPEEDE